MAGGVLAISGVSPGSYEVDFEPGLSQNFTFDFIFDEGVNAEVYVSGGLSEYVSLDKDSIVGGERVVATLNLPSNVNKSGLNEIRVGARQILEGEGGVGIVADVGGLIRLEVPYPGKYVELELVVPNANAGDLVDLSLKAYNRGEETVDVALLIQIFMDEDVPYATDLMVEEIKFDSVTIKPSEMEVFSTSLNTLDYSPGDYVATALGDYGEENLARGDNFFRLGELYVKILNYSKTFEEGGIERFSIEVESFWNNPINELYAEAILMKEKKSTKDATRSKRLSLSIWKPPFLR